MIFEIGNKVDTFALSSDSITSLIERVGIIAMQSKESGVAVPSERTWFCSPFRTLLFIYLFIYLFICGSREQGLVKKVIIRLYRSLN